MESEYLEEAALGVKVVDELLSLLCRNSYCLVSMVEEDSWMDSVGTVLGSCLVDDLCVEELWMGSSVVAEPVGVGFP